MFHVYEGNVKTTVSRLCRRECKHLDEMVQAICERTEVDGTQSQRQGAASQYREISCGEILHRPLNLPNHPYPR